MPELSDDAWTVLRGLEGTTEGTHEGATVKDIAGHITWVSMTPDHREHFPEDTVQRELAGLCETGLVGECAPGQFRVTGDGYDFIIARFEEKVAQMRARVEAGEDPFGDAA